MSGFTNNAVAVYPTLPVFSVDAATYPTVAIHELRSYLTLLYSNTRNPSTHHRVLNPTPPVFHSIQGAALDQFSGKPQDVKRFLQNLQDDMELLGPVFSSERLKVLYMASYLREARNVRDWVAYVRVSRPEWFNDFVVFVRAFEARFGSRKRSTRRFPSQRVHNSDAVLHST